MASADLAGIRATARAAGGSVNDAVLAAATGALHSLLQHRGEAVDQLAVAVFVSGSRRADPLALTNQVGVLPLTLPADGEPEARLRRISAITTEQLRRIARLSRHEGETSRLTSAILLEPLFRVAGALRLSRWYFNRQRRVNTFVTTLRGPVRPVRLLGTTVETIIPISNISGNLSVIMVALSYAGSLVVSAVLDPDTCPDGDVLQAQLCRQLQTLTTSAGSGRRDLSECGSTEHMGMQVKDELA